MKKGQELTNGLEIWFVECTYIVLSGSVGDIHTIYIYFLNILQVFGNFPLLNLYDNLLRFHSLLLKSVSLFIALNIFNCVPYFSIIAFKHIEISAHAS